jgi:DNA mismatch endonuclease (patch repair protein)
MTDTLDKGTRSAVMSRVRGKNTAPELVVRTMAHRLGYRFRLHRRGLPGTPDLVFPRLHKVIFVNGCFWHGHPDCDRARLPKTNIEFWRSKIGATVVRDRRAIEALRDEGWGVLVVWQCDTGDDGKLERVLRDFLSDRETL